MALATQVNSTLWARELNAVTAPLLPRRASGRPAGVIWYSTGPRLLARIRDRWDSMESHNPVSSASFTKSAPMRAAPSPGLARYGETPMTRKVARKLSPVEASVAPGLRAVR